VKRERCATRSAGAGRGRRSARQVSPLSRAVVACSVAATVHVPSRSQLLSPSGHEPNKASMMGKSFSFHSCDRLLSHELTTSSSGTSPPGFWISTPMHACSPGGQGTARL